MHGDLFKGIKQFEFPTPPAAAHLGKPSFLVPVYYYDNTSMTAIHTASTTLVRRYLPDARMHPLELTPGKCLVAFTAFEYRNRSL
jgi:hypothetical protein